MPEPALISAICVAAGCGGAFLLWIYQRAFGEGVHVQSNRATDTAAALALGKVELCATDLAAHKADDARQFGELGARVDAVNDGVEETKRMIAAGISDIRDDLRAMTVRIDALHQP